MIDINRYGWSEFFLNSFNKIKSDGMEFGRIITENKSNYIAVTKYGEIICELTGKLMFASEKQSELPKVGDSESTHLFGWGLIQQNKRHEVRTQSIMFEESQTEV